MRALRNGFTLIELISTLVVLGVLALVSVAFFRNDDMGAYVERDRLFGQLIYARAQGMAMGGGQCVEVTNKGVGFPVQRKENTFAVGSLVGYAFSSGVSVNAYFTSICFDAAGSACSGKLEDTDGTGILYCNKDNFPKDSFSVDFDGKVRLEVYATGFVQ